MRKDKLFELLRQIRRVLSTSIFIIAVVTVISVVYGLVADGRFTIEYVFVPNYVVAAVLIAGGLLFPAAPNRFVDKIRSRQLADYNMHKDYMDSRAQKQKQGFKILWVGIASASITGIVEIIIWLI